MAFIHLSLVKGVEKPVTSKSEVPFIAKYTHFLPSSLQLVKC